MSINEAIVIAFDPPAIQGLGQFGGFCLRAAADQRRGSGTWESIMQQIIDEANTRPELAHPLFTTFTTHRDPQFVVQIDREKAKSLNVPLPGSPRAAKLSMGRNT